MSTAEDDFESGATRVTTMAELGLSGPHALLLMVSDGQIFRLPLTKDVSVVGRAVESDVKLDFVDVSRKHFKITKRQDGTYAIADLGSSGGTFVTPEDLPEKKLTGEQTLHEHEIIRVGAHKFRFVVPHEVKEEDYPKLLPMSGGTMVQLKGAVVTVGRSLASFVIPDPRVSTKHAVIETFAKGSVYIVDQKSANGTTVNGEKLTDARKLEENDVIAFAGIAYRFSMLGADSRTMVVSATGAPRAVVGTGTLRMDEARQQIMEALAEQMTGGHMETQAIVQKPAKEGRSSTGTYTGPNPLQPAEPERAPGAAQARATPSAPTEPEVQEAPAPPSLLEKPGAKLGVRIGAAALVIALLLYPYVLTVTGECRLAPGAIQKVRSAISGRVAKVMVVEGQKVKEGELLLELAALDGQKVPVEQLQVRAGIAGKIVTQAPQNLLNQVVNVGQELLEVDETQRVIAEVLVPESDIGDVYVGQPVYARLYTDTTETHESQVQTIVPVAEKGALGSFVVVKAQLKNPDERLIPGTTGVAKLVGERHMGIVLLFKKIARIVK